jgi:hypothetical protein
MEFLSVEWYFWTWIQQTLIKSNLTLAMFPKPFPMSSIIILFSGPLILASTYEREHTVFDFLCLAYFTSHKTSCSIHFATNWQDSNLFIEE